MLEQFLKDSWSFFKNHIVAMSLIILPIAIPVEVFTALYRYLFVSETTTFMVQILLMAINFVVTPIYSIAVVFYIASVVSGKKIDITGLWELGMQFWGPYLVLSIFVGIIVVTGLFLLIIPGIIVAARYAFAEFDLLFNKQSPFDAMAKSWEMTREYIWVIFSGYAVITLVIILPYYIIASFFDKQGVSFLIMDSITNIIYTVLSVLYTIFSFRVYEFIRMAKNT